MSDDIEILLKRPYGDALDIMCPTRVLRRAADEIERLRSELTAARSAALEEAAKAAEAHKPPQLSDWEDYWNWSDSRDAIAAAIRDLKDK